ncbi:MAG: 3-dehydroquinate synthase [Candidatus Bipolaricaulota bacterium]
MEEIEVDLGQRSYYITIEEGSLKDAGGWLLEISPSNDFVVITDETVDDLYRKELSRSLDEAGCRYDRLVIPPGEKSKNLSTAGELYERLGELNLDRDSTLVAFGGGVVGDLGGFLASTFLRGLSLVQIPTTLLAQVDSSVGGKTAINLSAGKNMVGTFYQPQGVLIDPLVLTTLADPDVRSGLGEVLKYGLIWDEKLFHTVVSDLGSFYTLDNASRVERVIRRCCEIKAEIVRLDERDRGLRQILNFGHTVGHGVEAGSGYGYMRHGEAVLWGMIGEAWISRDKGGLSEAALEEIVASLKEVNAPPLPGDLTGGELLKYVKRDKKNRGGRINSVLLEGIGGDAVVNTLEEEEIISALEYLEGLR